MPIEIQLGWKDFESSITSIPLTFSDVIQKVVVGIFYFKLNFAKKDGHEDHKVKRFSVTLDYKQPRGSSNMLNVNVNTILRDASGNSVQSGTVKIAAVALTGKDDSHVALELCPKAIKNGRNSKLTLDWAPEGGFDAFLWGFDLVYKKFFRDTDNCIHTVMAGANISPVVSKTLTGKDAPLWKRKVTINGKAEMYDASNHYARTAEIYAGLVAAKSSSAGIQIVEVPTIQTDSKFPVQFSEPIKAVAVLISNFNISYPQGKDHNIEYIEVGCSGWPIPDPDKKEKEVVLNNAIAKMIDNSNHNSDDNQSNVSLIVVGLLEPNS